jgi:hypothetical protein
MKPMTIRPQPRLHRCVAALLLLSLACDLQAEERLYRYKNDKGVTAIDDHVPPEFVKNGYDILTKDLRVIETVPRQLTGEEGKRQRAAADAARKQAEWDKRLLLRYSNTVDIEEARDRALAEFDVRISILQSNLRSIKSQIETEQARAADMERRGQPVPEAVTRNIAALKKEIAFTEDSVAQRRKEKEATRQSFQRDIERFKVLNPLVEMRRKAAQSEGEAAAESAATE